MSSTTVSRYAGAAYTFGVGSLWASTSNAAGAPDGQGSLAFVFPGDTSRYLYMRNFAFNIPCNSTIESITVRITRRNRSTTDAVDAAVSTFNPITLETGSANLADPSIYVEGGAWETISYTDLTWGETLTPELVNNNRFGIVLQTENPLTAGRAEPMIDAVEMEICYTVMGPPSTPIFFTLDKVDACYGEGSITVNATGGLGTYEYSIDAGMNWQSSNSFTGLSQDDYVVVVRNSDMTCMTSAVNTNLSGDERMLQPGDAVLTCATFPGNRVTLGVEKLQPFHDFYITGETGYDVSSKIGPHSYKFDIDDFGGEVFSTAIDPDRNIYTATTIMYDLSPGSAIPVHVCRIDALTAEVYTLITLPGDAGAAGVEYDADCDQVFVANLSNGIIYRIDPVTGALLSSFDPINPDNGAPDIAPLGERVLSVAYNPSDNRLYYSMWNSDYNRSGIRNTIRSISIDPGTCDFLPATDQEEIVLPWTSEYGDIGVPDDFSMPVADMEFSQDGSTLIMSESGFNSSVPVTVPHESRVLRYTGSSMSWTLQTSLPPGNTNIQYEFGEVSAGLNARGGIAFANSGFSAFNCSIDDEQFIIGTADALRGADCNTLGCIYGLQYTPISGGKSSNSVLLDVGRDLNTQQKSVFGDIDMVAGCPEPLYCCPNLSSSEPDVVICPGDATGTMDVQTQADSLVLVYHTSVPADSAAVYTDGTPIDTAEVIGGLATLSLAGLDVSSPITYYVYAITHPTSDLDYCRPYDSIVVNVRNLPVVSLNDPTDRCIDASDMNFTGSPVPGAMQSGSFTSTSPGGFTDNGDGTAMLDISAAGAGTYTIEYIFTDEFGCSNTSSVDVTINDLPVVTLGDPGDICLDGSPLNFSATPVPASGISGVYTSTAGSGFTDNGDGTASLDPALAGVGSYDVSYIFTDNNGCVNMQTVSVEVISLPVASISDPPDECLLGSPMNFTGNPIPGGGTSGSFSSSAAGGLVDNGDGTASLDPGLAGPGIYDVDYLYTDANGCQDLATTSVQVFDTLPYVDLNRGAVCGDPSFGSNVLDLNTLILSGPGGGTWADTDGTGSLSGSDFTANPAMEGNSYTFTYTITGPGPAATQCQTRSFDVIVDVEYCYLDLALIKTSPQVLPVQENDIITYDVTICNQGFTYVDSIEIMDYMAPCYGFTPNNGWLQAGPNVYRTLTITNGGLPAGGLPPVNFAPGNCITISLDLEIRCGDPADLVSYSEITASRDVAGNTDDFDSTPGSDSPAENSVTPGSPDDDSFNDLFEDDHDPATMPLADVALIMNISSSGPYVYGDPVAFEIMLFNQGNIDLYNLEISDYIPCGFSFDSGINPSWSESGGIATTTITQLDVGQNTSRTILLTIEEEQVLCNNALSWVNEAEVSEMFDVFNNNISLLDYDSRSDQVQGNDGGGAAGTASDGVLFGDGTGVPGSTDPATDEDDHDPALFNLYDLAIEKLVTSSGPYGQDSIVSFQIIVHNQGGIPANNIEVEDYPEFGLQYDSSDAGINANVTELGSHRWRFNSLLPGESDTINLLFHVASGFQDLNLDNEAEIILDDGDDIDSDPSQDSSVDEDGDGNGYDDDEDAVSITVAQYYDLSISKTEVSSGPYVQSSLITYEISVFNDGTLNASNILIEEYPGFGLSFIGDDSGLNANVNSLGGGIYEIINLPFGFSESFQITYELSSSYQDTIVSNRVMIIQDDGNDIDSDPDFDFTIDEDGDLDPFDDDEAEIILDVYQFYDLSIQKTEISSGPYLPGANVSYRIDVINEGSLNAANIEIEDIPDADLAFVSDDSGSNPNVSSTGVLSYLISNIPFGTSESIVVTFQIDPVYQDTLISNYVHIISDDGDDIDSDPAFDETVDENGDLDGDDDDEDRIITNVTQYYDLSISKTLVTPGDIYPGDPITFRIDIINEGTLHAANIDITEDPDFGLFYVSNTTGGDPNISEITPNLFAISSLPAYSSTSFEITYTIDFSYLSPQINNIVRISADDGDDRDSDPAFDETVDEDGDGDGFDDDEAINTVGVFVGFSIGDFVWHDLDGNGVQDFGEPGIEGIKVEVRTRQGFLVERTYTDADGLYYFDEVYPGDYYLKFEIPEEYQNTLSSMGGDPGRDSDINGDNGPGTTSLLSLGADDPNIDAGLIQCANIGGTVWFDYNTNNIEDLTENGINGMIVELYKLEPYGWTLWDSQVTGHKEGTGSEDGFYKFCANPGTYYLKFLNPPQTLVVVGPGFGPEDKDSDVTGRYGEGTTDDFTVLSGDEYCDIGAGYYIMGSIGDYVWNDSNGNGMRDGGEQGVEGVTVNAINAEGDIVASTISDADGNYVIDYLGRDAYFIQIEEPEGYLLSLANAGNDDSIDSDIDHTNGYGTSQYYAIEPGNHTGHVDIGLVSAAILPVEWISFEGYHESGYNKLEWTLGSEINVSNYIIERSEEDEFIFEPIASVEYKYSSMPTNRYLFNDRISDPDIEFYQYRIRQVDIDGRFSYSNIISIEVEGATIFSPRINIYPNPAVDFINVEWDENIGEDVSIELLDTKGLLVKRIDKNENSVLHESSIGGTMISLQDIDTGIYIIKINMGSKVKMYKIVKADP